MTLTPLTKFVVITTAFVVNLFLLIWLGIKVDVFALGLNEHVYNIVAIVLTFSNSGVTALLVYLGLKAPTIEESTPLRPSPAPPSP